MSLRNITPKETTLTVSSTFDKSSNKKNLLDGNPETCWSSQQGLPQHIHLKLPELMPVTHLAITFQGGFSGTTVGLYLASERVGTQGTEGFDVGLIFAGKIYPKDGNGRQVFELPIPEAIPDSIHSSGPHVEGSEPTTDERQKHWVKEIKLEFEKSADPWGRIVVYDLEVLG